MLTKILIVSVIALSGLAVGLIIQPKPTTVLPLTSTTQPNSNQLFEKIFFLQSRIEQLESQLTIENVEHEKNRNQLIKLSNLIKKIQSTKNNADDQSGKNQLDEKQTLFDVSVPRLTESEKNKKILLSMGIDNDDATQIQHLAEKKEMAHLYLRNTAAREGWFGTEKYFEKTRELDLKSNIYRDSLGDDKYDQFLYASQQTNRISVQSVLSESPAAIAGLQAGDYILSYDNKRVFNWSDLTSLTSDGIAGESIPIEIKRNDQISQIYIDRGPLGIRLATERVQPVSQN